MSTTCPTQFSDAGLLSLPESNNMRLVGIPSGSKALHVLPRREIPGFVVHDPSTGEFITQQPNVPIPVLRSLVLDANGQPVPLPGGGYEEDQPPRADFMLVTGKTGQQWRWRGRPGYRQMVKWNGCQFVFEEDPKYSTLEDYSAVLNAKACGYYDAALVQNSDGTWSLGYKMTPNRLAGEVTMWAGQSNLIPDGWLICDGQDYDPEVYPDLFAAIGYAWGKVGDNFRVPDSRGRVPRFVDGGEGEDPDASARVAKYTGGNTGDDVGTYQDDAMQCHGHDLEFDYGGYAGGGTGIVTDDPITTDPDPGVGDPAESNCGEPRTASETRMKNLGFYAIICTGCVLD